MTRSHLVALLGGLSLGIGIGVVALFLVMNRVQMVVPPPAAPIVAATPAPPPAASTKPTVQATLRKKPTTTPRPQATADSRRTAPIGSGGMIFSGADSNDPRVYHFAD